MKRVFVFGIFIILSLSLVTSMSYYWEQSDGTVIFYKMVPTSNPDIQVSEVVGVYDSYLLRCSIPKLIK